MKEFTEDAKYTMTIRDINGNRIQLLFDDHNDIYEYCNRMSTDSNGSDYEILDLIKYQTIWNNTFAIPLYVATKTYMDELLWEDLLAYIA